MENPTARTTRRRSRPRGGRGAIAAALAVLALVLAACGDDGDDATTADAGDTGGGGGGGDALSIEVAAPADGDEVGDTFDLELDTSVELGEPDTGLHHVHLYYDGETAEGEYDLVYDTSFTVERDLGEGEHTIEAVIANADHSLTEARDELTVTVGSGAPAGDDTDDTEDEPAPNPY